MGFQSPSTQQGLRVGDLKDPRTGRTFRTVKYTAALVNVKKYFLNKIVGLTSVPKNS
jgi:hypothetical protein